VDLIEIHAALPEVFSWLCHGSLWRRRIVPEPRGSEGAVTRSEVGFLCAKTHKRAEM